jgi:Raf kinase inhibitor-like YbhB/YbcL family protein
MHVRLPAVSAFILSVTLAVMVLSAGCISSSPPAPLQPSSELSQQEPSTRLPVQTAGAQGSLALSVDLLSPGSVLPDIYTCKGASTSPQVSWSGIPPGSKSLVLILEDPDAPNGIYTHWLVYNIPPQSGEISEGQTNAKVLSNGAQQGESSNGFRGYYPPCPPVGSTHRYIFRLYALDIYLALPTADRAAIDRAMTGHTFAKTEFTTIFRR